MMVFFKTATDILSFVVTKTRYWPPVWLVPNYVFRANISQSSLTRVHCRTIDDIGSLSMGALQTMERLYLHLLKQNKYNPESVPADAVTQSTAILDQLRLLRGNLEGSSLMPPIILEDEDLNEFLLMYDTQEINNVELKERLLSRLQRRLRTLTQRLLFVAVISCPWLRVANQYHHHICSNSLFTVFVSNDQDYFTPLQPPLRDEAQVYNLRQLHAVELFHFAHYLTNGKASYVEIFSLPQQAILLQTNEWIGLSNKLNEILGNQIYWRGFIDQCLGHALDVVARRLWDDDCTRPIQDFHMLTEFSHSARLLHHASRALSGLPLNWDPLSLQESLTEHSKATLMLLTKAFQDSVSKRELCEAMLLWCEHLREQLNQEQFLPVVGPLKQPVTLSVNFGQSGQASKNFSEPIRVQTNLKNLSSVSNCLNEPVSTRLWQTIDDWQLRVRNWPGVEGANTTAEICAARQQVVNELISRFGSKLMKLPSENIIAVAQAGSQLYGLKTSTSDIDYIIIYKEDPMNALSLTGRYTKTFDGQRSDMSFKAYEAQFFCELICKGSVMITELLCVDEIYYSSKDWKKLTENRHQVFTERLVLQYFGLIIKCLNDAERNRHGQATQKDRKLFYQAFHKLYCVNFIMDGQCPPVRMPEGPERDFIMKIRKEPFQGEFSRDKLLEYGKEQVYSLRQKQVDRSNRLPENVSIHWLSRWIMELRGWPY